MRGPAQTRTCAVAFGSALLASVGSVFAAEPTVASLLAEGYVVVAAIPTQIGPGLFLQKGDRLFACFVSETPSSADLSTRYCKPVR